MIYGEQSYDLQAEDFMVVNFLRPCTVERIRNGVVGRITLNQRILSSYIDLYEYDFECYSPDLRPEHSKRLRWLIYQIFSNYYRSEGIEQLLLNSHYYQLLFRLCEGSLIRRSYEPEEAQDAAIDPLISRILDHMRRNYSQRITLDDLSEITFFSSAYLSKYIKKKTGRNFLDLLNTVRLQHAVDELSRSDKTVMKIALDNGFPNTASFNRIFRKEYGENPSAYQKRIQEERTAAAIVAEESGIEEKVRDFLESHQESYAIEDRNTLALNCSVADAERSEHPWSFMINGGLAKDLLKADMQQHILILHRELHFSYVRFWDIYSPEMFLKEQSADTDYNFKRLDLIVDFLLENGMRPYMELGNKPILLMQNSTEALISEQREDLFRTREEYTGFLKSLMRHYINRYGVEEVEKWYFEQWRSAQEKDIRDYFELFETVYRTLKQFSPNIRIGGAGINRDQYDLFEDIIKAWSRRPYRPDFITVYSYPFLNRAKEPNLGQSRDPFFMRKYLEYAASILDRNGFDGRNIHVTEWNFTISSRNPLNDSVFKGAYVVRNLLGQIGKARLSGYWLGSDLFSEFYDSRKLLEGSAGLLTKDGIRKPAFYGFEFMNDLDNYILGRNENAVVTTNLHDSYTIVCCNYDHPSYRYYIRKENEITVSEMNSCFDGEGMRMRVRISGVRNGRYQIRTRRVSREYGSVQDEWLRMGLSDELGAKDIRYLQQVCVPRISIETAEITDGELVIDSALETNEIQQIRILYQIR